MNHNSHYDLRLTWFYLLTPKYSRKNARNETELTRWPGLAISPVLRRCKEMVVCILRQVMRTSHKLMFNQRSGSS